MKWNRIGPTAWECKPFRIAAAKIGEAFHYTLFQHEQMIQTFSTSEEAKQSARGMNAAT